MGGKWQVASDWLVEIMQGKSWPLSPLDGHNLYISMFNEKLVLFLEVEQRAVILRGKFIQKNQNAMCMIHI